VEQIWKIVHEDTKGIFKQSDLEGEFLLVMPYKLWYTPTVFLFCIPMSACVLQNGIPGRAIGKDH
jgi:hypothetical protein